MTSTLASIGATVVEILFYHRVPFSQSYYALSGYIIFRKDVVFQVVPDLGDPCIGTSLSNWGGPMRSPGSSVVHTTLGRLHGWIATGIASFEVLDRSPSPSSAGWVVGFSSRLSKTPLGTGAQVDALMERSSAAELNSRGTCCSSKASKSFSSFLTWMRYAASWGLLQLQSPRTCLMIS